MSRAWILGFAVAAVVACGCSKQHPTPGRGGPAMLRHVPADTAYVVTNLEPWSRAYYDRYLAENRAQLDGALHKLRETREGALPFQRFLLAFMEEVARDFTATGLEKLGFNPQAHAVIYGLGLLPVMRVELSDGAAVDALLQRVAQQAELPLPRETHRGRSHYAFRPDGQVVVLVSVEPRELVVTVAPAAMDKRILDLVRGDAPIGPSLADSGELQKIAAAEGFAPQLVGVIDWRRAAAALVDTGRPLTREVLTAFGATVPDPSCRAELESLAALSPRWIVGATELGARRTAGVMIAELSPLIARDLVAARAPVPGVGAPLGDAVASMGAAGDVGKLIALVRRGASVVNLAPYRCAQLAPLNRAAAELTRDLSKPLPSWVAELRGFTFILDSLQSGLAMPDIKAYAVLAASDPIQLIDMAKRAMSPLAGISIPPDGRPVPIPGGVLPLMTGHVAMKGQLLGLSLGGGSELKLVRLMSTAPAGSMPLLSMAFDGVKLAAVMKALGGAFGGQTTDTSSFGRGVSHLVMDATERGLVVRVEQVSPKEASPTP